MSDYPPRPTRHKKSTGSGLTGDSDPSGDHKLQIPVALIGAAGAIIAAAVGAYIGLKPATSPSPAQTASAATSAAAPGSTPSSVSAHLSSPLAAGGSITGDWNVTYGTPATVTITLAGGTYTESAKTRVLIIPGVSCYLQPGTAISTFTRTGPGTYAGHANVWSENTCTINGTTSMTLALSGDGNTLIASQAHGVGILPTVIFTRIQGAHQ
jgi:hypothetical protein